MKNVLNRYLILGLLVGFVPNSFAQALPPGWSGDLTALSFENTKKNVWVGVKEGGRHVEVYSYLFKIALENKIARKSDAHADEALQSPLKVELPKNIRDREIIGLASHQDKLLVITQWTVEQGDEPLVHVYFPTRKTWRMIGKIPCNSVASIELKNNVLNYACENEDNQVQSGEVKLPRNLMSGANSRILPASNEEMGARETFKAKIQMMNKPL